MKKKCLIYVFLLSSLFSFSQKKDSSYYKNNFIYINPFFFSNDVLELNDYWASIGYDRRLNKKIIVGLNFSTIVTSYPSKGVFYGSGFNAIKSKGIRVNFETKFLLSKIFYSSINLFYQKTQTFCQEDIIDYTSISPVLIEHTYTVNRDAYSLIPKIGFLFKKYNKKLYADLNFGFGLKYISSNTINKIGALSSKRESYSGKIFEYGKAFTYHPLIHLKIGYNF